MVIGIATNGECVRESKFSELSQITNTFCDLCHIIVKPHSKYLKSMIFRTLTSVRRQWT